MSKLTRPLYRISRDHLGFLMQSCMKSKALQPGKQIHAQLIVVGMGMQIGFLDAKLIGMYAGCRDMTSSMLVFERMRKPTVFAWNWMISVSAFQGDFENAIRFFARMQEAGAMANKFTFSNVLKACVGLLEINKGKELHAIISRRGLESDVFVANALVDMYSKCGDLEAARKLFDRMPARDVASWTSLICGYSQGGKLEESWILFKMMKLERTEPNDFTWNSMIAGYAQNGDCERVFDLITEMKKDGLEPDLITWNAIIAGFAQNQLGLEAMQVFVSMLAAGFKPNSVTVAGLLPALGLIGSLRKGKQVHGLIFRRGLELNIFTLTALVDMYSKCGSVEDARKIFDRATKRNDALWNAMIGCYGKHGLVDASVKLFERMQRDGVQPNQVTFTCLLSACSHGGLVEKGLEIFRVMREVYGLELGREHYACVVDLLCRSGQLVEAYDLLKRMPMKANGSVVGAFFNGCRIHGRSDMAKDLAEEILQMELQKPAGFVLLSNIYAADGKWEGVENVREVMKQKGIRKKPGCSWVEKKDELVGFRIGKNRILSVGFGAPET